MSSLCLHASHHGVSPPGVCDKYYDNACSHSMVPSLHYLHSVETLLSPFSIGGIGGSSLLATHVGARISFSSRKGLLGSAF